MDRRKDFLNLIRRQNYEWELIDSKKVEEDKKSHSYISKKKELLNNDKKKFYGK
jgi:hypothetical protein